jgi:hypothetical protein
LTAIARNVDVHPRFCAQPTHQLTLYQWDVEESSFDRCLRFCPLSLAEGPPCTLLCSRSSRMLPVDCRGFWKDYPRGGGLNFLKNGKMPLGPPRVHLEKSSHGDSAESTYVPSFRIVRQTSGLRKRTFHFPSLDRFHALKSGRGVWIVVLLACLSSGNISLRGGPLPRVSDLHVSFFRGVVPPLVAPKGVTFGGGFES